VFWQTRSSFAAVLGAILTRTDPPLRRKVRKSRVQRSFLTQCDILATRAHGVSIKRYTHLQVVDGPWTTSGAATSTGAFEIVLLERA
jgi:hypothetical protein